MTEHETYVQALRALKRLRSKQLLSGPDWQDGYVCAIGALAAHFYSSGVMPSIPMEATRKWMGIEHRYYIMCENDDYRRWDNSPPARKMRYRHMVSWLEKRIAETALNAFH